MAQPWMAYLQFFLSFCLSLYFSFAFIFSINIYVLVEAKIPALNALFLIFSLSILSLFKISIVVYIYYFLKFVHRFFSYYSIKFVQMFSSFSQGFFFQKDGCFFLFLWIFSVLSFSIYLHLSLFLSHTYLKYFLRGWRLQFRMLCLRGADTSFFSFLSFSLNLLASLCRSLSLFIPNKKVPPPPGEGSALDALFERDG